MAFQNSPGSSAGKEQEVGKVKGEQEKAEEGGEIWEKEHRTLHVSVERRRDKLPHIPNMSLGLWKWWVCVNTPQFKMKRISSRVALPYSSVPSEVDVVQTHAGGPAVLLQCFSSTVKRSDPSTGTPGLSNQTCLACVTHGFISPPYNYGTCDISDDLHATGTSREELLATSPRHQSHPHSALFNVWVVSPLSAELVCCDIRVSDGRVSSPAPLSHRTPGLMGKGEKFFHMLC